MNTSPPDSRRIKPVLIRDVPLRVRRTAATHACKNEDDPYERLRIRMLAERPGDLVAWVAP